MKNVIANLETIREMQNSLRGITTDLSHSVYGMSSHERVSLAATLTAAENRCLAIISNDNTPDSPCL